MDASRNPTMSSSVSATLAGTGPGAGTDCGPRSAEPADAPVVSLLLNPLIGAVILAGVVVLALGLQQADTAHWEALVILAIGAVLAERLDISIYGNARLSLAFIPIFAALIMFGLLGVALVAPLAAISSSFPKRRAIHKTAFNAATLVLAGAASVAIFEATRVNVGTYDWPEVFVPAALAALANFAVNSVLVAAAINLTGRTGLRSVWTEHFGWLWPHYIVLGFFGLSLAAAYSAIGVWGIAIFAAPPLMMRFSFQQYVNRTAQSVLDLRRANADLQDANHRVVDALDSLEGAYAGTLRALAAALDARDAATGGHSERVASLTMEVAAEMGIPADTEQWRDIEWGALLHDVGKIAVPDDILRKPGALTDEEWQAMRSHPQAGFDILQGVDFLRAAAGIVRAHHERFDGAGYPLGLAGEEIPLGARIFAVGDSFDAMTVDRPYRPAGATEEALAEILRGSGTQFDPNVVQAFLAVYAKRFAGNVGTTPHLSTNLKRAILKAAGMD